MDGLQKFRPNAGQIRAASAEDFDEKGLNSNRIHNHQCQACFWTPVRNKPPTFLVRYSYIGPSQAFFLLFDAVFCPNKDRL